jgi:hypothetical protein
MMLEQHESHIVSTYTTALQHLAEIRQVVTTGETPAGGRVAPWPEPERERLVASVDAVAAGLEAIVRSFAPHWEDMGRRTGGLAATRMWVSILLRTVEELVEEIRPARMSRRYGALGAADVQRLGGQVEGVISSLRSAMRMVSEQGDESRG